MSIRQWVRLGALGDCTEEVLKPILGIDMCVVGSVSPQFSEQGFGIGRDPLPDDADPEPRDWRRFGRHRSAQLRGIVIRDLPEHIELMRGPEMSRQTLDKLGGRRYPFVGFQLF